MRQYIFFYQQPGKGVFASVSRNGTEQEEPKRNEFKISGISFFRRSADGTAVKLSRLFEYRLFLNKGFYIEQPREVSRHRTLAPSKGEVAFIDMSTDTLCVDADVVGLKKPCRILVTLVVSKAGPR